MGGTGSGEPVSGEDVTRMAPRGTERTVAAGRAAQPKDPEATVAAWASDVGIDPVVGWLVCFNGPNRGRDYRIRAGFNAIGRDTASQICIAGDETISREEHARIFFDPKTAEFHVVPGNGRSGIYVNNKVVLQPTRIEAHDCLELGKTQLVFVPLCGERFSWVLEA